MLTEPNHAGGDRWPDAGASDRWDAVIVGGGAAGLTLLAHLAASDWRDRRVLLVDRDERPSEHRIWAYWSTSPAAAGNPLAGAETLTWGRLAVHAAGHTHLLDPAPYTYRLVTGRDLLRVADALAATAPGFARATAAVLAIDDGQGPGNVALHGGRVLRADWVFDSRPPAAARPGEVAMRFLGQEIAASRPVFDPTIATFMDFRAGTAGRVRFGYTLPLSPTHALVEIAEFADPTLDDGPDAAALERYLTQTYPATDWRTLRQEHGELPLRPPPRQRGSGRVLPVGLPGGLLKPSTGYAFSRIVRDTAAITGSLVCHGHPFALPVRRARHRLLDQVLLQVVRDEPERIEAAFARMFTGNPTRRVLRFLDEDTSTGEEIRLAATLPMGAFLRAARRVAVDRRAAR